MESRRRIPLCPTLFSQMVVTLADANQDGMTFAEAFDRAQSALGLAHYHVTLSPDAGPENYADIDAEAEDCIATIRYNPARCHSDEVTESTATHEALHLLLRDLVHAIESNPRAARIEEERVVRRLESLVTKSIFTTN